MVKVLTIFGTRPEAIKLAPVIIELRKYPDFDVLVCVTAQHREMLDQVLRLFGIVPNIDLNLMQPGQMLSDLTARVVSQVDRILEKNRPDVIQQQLWLPQWRHFIVKCLLDMWKQD